mmetsp:Transcript_77881/g.252069  ORF Transcript_77881/g.252069 Transcript_77881/m.252069 type:complete len:205 (-) Transcript_77881:392-1006(-)
MNIVCVRFAPPQREAELLRKTRSHLWSQAQARADGLGNDCLVEGLVPAEDGHGEVVVHGLEGQVDRPHVGAPAVRGEEGLHRGQGAPVPVLQVQQGPAEGHLHVARAREPVELVHGVQPVGRQGPLPGVDEVVQEEHHLLRLPALQVARGHALRPRPPRQGAGAREPAVREAPAALQEAAVHVLRQVVGRQPSPMEPVLPIDRG